MLVTVTRANIRGTNKIPEQIEKQTITLQAKNKKILKKSFKIKKIKNKKAKKKSNKQNQK